MTVIDLRLGFREKNGRISRWPSKYFNGTPFSKFANPSPTQYWVNEEYFVVLPTGVGSIDDGIYEELLALVAPVAKAQAKKVEEPVVEEVAEKVAVEEPVVEEIAAEEIVEEKPAVNSATIDAILSGNAPATDETEVEEVKSAPKKGRKTGSDGK